MRYHITKTQIAAGVAITTCAALVYSAALLFSAPRVERLPVETTMTTPSPVTDTVLSCIISTDTRERAADTSEPLDSYIMRLPYRSERSTAEPTLVVEREPEPEPEWTYRLTQDEYETACHIVMGEAGGEPYEGKMAVAQCILDACVADGIAPSDVRREYKYSGWRDTYTDDVERAVLAVFRDGERVCDEDIMYFYAPAVCGYSSWHETQHYVLTIGGHRFFAGI